MLMESNYKSPGIDMIPFRDFMLRSKSFFGIILEWNFVGIFFEGFVGISMVFVDSFGDCH